MSIILHTKLILKYGMFSGMFSVALKGPSFKCKREKKRIQNLMQTLKWPLLKETANVINTIWIIFI